MSVPGVSNAPAIRPTSPGAEIAVVHRVDFLSIHVEGERVTHAIGADVVDLLAAPDFIAGLHRGFTDQDLDTALEFANAIIPVAADGEEIEVLSPLLRQITPKSLSSGPPALLASTSIRTSSKLKPGEAHTSVEGWLTEMR